MARTLALRVPALAAAVSILAGCSLAPDYHVIDTPPDGLVDGDRVQVASTAKKVSANG
ncbi:hypothetical protein [Caballeronia sp. M23-90]